MSDDKKVKVDVNMLTGAKDAERSLAKEETRKLEDSIPEGHILKDEIDKQKALLGDLGDLPPGHPLIKMLMDAKARYETKDEREEEQGKTAEVRKAKKIEKSKQRREEEERRVAAEGFRKDAAKNINKGIDSLMSGIRSVCEDISEAEEVLNRDPSCKVKVMKAKRLLFAMERGISECRITRV